ncbi:unnamed protein product [Arabidopsis halleri]
MVEVEELEPLSPIEDEEEEISYDDLKKRMWKDRNLMEKLKQRKRHNNDVVSFNTHRAEASRRKKMARSQDSVLKYMMKIMEVCKAKGFVYGIVPEKGKPITGSSDSLRRWWKENAQFDQNAPDAITDYLTLAAAAELIDKSSSSSNLLVATHVTRATRHNSRFVTISVNATLHAATAAVSVRERNRSAMVADGDGALVGRARSGI